MKNQPAFPRTGYYPPEAKGTEAWQERAHTETEPERGMTLRDYFAAKALQGMHARDTFDKGQATPQQRASLAYIDADAMLKAREQ